MKSIKLRGLVAAVAGAWMIGAAPLVMADSTDDIINALIGKGVLTEEEGALLMRGRAGEKEAAEAKKKDEIKGKFKDGISWESGDKANSISVNGRIQLDYRTFDGDSSDLATTDGWDVRRAYLGVKGKFANYYEFGVVTDFAAKDDPTKDKSAQLDEAYLNINWWKQAQFKFGQFKMPMSLEEQTSSRFIDFQERSLMNKFVPGKEIGAMIHGEPTPGVFYGLALSTGEGKNKVEGKTNEGSDIIGRVGVNIAELVGHKDNVYHIAASASTGELSNSLSLSDATEGKGQTFFSTSGKSNVERDRFGLEGAAAFGPIKLQGEWLRSNFQGTGFDNDIDVWYAEALWMITGEKYADSYKAGKFDRIKPLNDFNPDGKGMGAWEVGVRYSKFDASDFKSGGWTTTSGFTSEVEAWSLGLKWIPMPNTRFLANYVRTDFDTPITCNGHTCDKEDAFTVRAQFDF